MMYQIKQRDHCETIPKAASSYTLFLLRLRECMVVILTFLTFVLFHLCLDIIATKMILLVTVS